MTTTGVCERLEWDSSFFGRSIARALAPRLDEATCQSMLDWCHAERIDCLYVLVESDHPLTTGLLEQAGFHLVDIRLTLDAPVGGPREAPAFTRAARGSDLPALRDIAGTCHRNTRFYRDGHFDRDRCDEMYRVWIERSCSSPAEHVIVAERDGAPVGYVTLGRQSTDLATIGLIGVSPAHQRHRVGRDLMSAGLAWLAGQRMSRVSVVTQGHNVASQRLYQGAGFRTASVALWYHRWFTERTPSR